MKRSTMYRPPGLNNAAAASGHTCDGGKYMILNSAIDRGGGSFGHPLRT
jgi:hypothetical protein